MNHLVIFVNAVSICFGIPCALVRNCVMPPMNICMINRFPSSIGWPLFHLLRVVSILSRIGSQGVVLSSSFPIQAPRDLMGLLSWAILIVFSQGSSSVISFLVVITVVLCALDPIGRISVFSMLNLAPDARHHFCRMSFRSLYLS